MKMRKFMLIAVASLALVACNKEKKDATTTQSDETAVVETPVVTEPVVYGYESKDAQRHFELTFLDESHETVELKDVEENVVYNMQMVVAASGSKWESSEGYYFWTKGETFYFGNGEEILSEGAQTTPSVVEE